MDLEIRNPVLAIVYAWVKDPAIMASLELRKKAKEMTEKAIEECEFLWNCNSGWTSVFRLKDEAARLEAKATRVENMICFRSLWIFSGWESLTWTAEMILILKKELEANNQFYREHRESLDSEPSSKSVEEMAKDRVLEDKKREYGSLRDMRIVEEIAILEKLECLAERLRAHIYPEVDQDDAGNILADFYHQILIGKRMRPF